MDSIKIIRGNDTDLVARIRRKEGDVTSPYDLTGAGKIRVAVVGQGAHIFAKDVTVDGNALSFRIPGRPLHLGKHTLEITFTLDGYDKRIAGRDMVEVVESLVDSTEMTAVEEGAAIEFTLTVTPEVIDIGGFSGNYEDLDNKPDLTIYATIEAMGTALAGKQGFYHNETPATPKEGDIVVYPEVVGDDITATRDTFVDRGQSPLWIRVKAAGINSYTFSTLEVYGIMPLWLVTIPTLLFTVTYNFGYYFDPNTDTSSWKNKVTITYPDTTTEEFYLELGKYVKIPEKVTLYGSFTYSQVKAVEAEGTYDAHIYDIISISTYQPTQYKEYHKSAWRDILDIDTTPTNGSGNLITSGGVKTALETLEVGKQNLFLNTADNPPANPKEGDIWDMPAMTSALPVIASGGMMYYGPANENVPVRLILSAYSTTVNVVVQKKDGTSETLTDASEFPKDYAAGIVNYVSGAGLEGAYYNMPAAKKEYINGQWETRGAAAPDVVKYTQQSLTDPQKNQTRKNIGLYYEETSEVEVTAQYTDEAESAISGYAKLNGDTPAKTDIISIAGGGTQGQDYDFSDRTDGFVVYPIGAPAGVDFRIVLDNSAGNEPGVYFNLGGTEFASWVTLVYTKVVTTISKIPSRFLPEIDLPGKQDKMVMLVYNVSTWQQFLDAYNKNAVVYCVASGRLAFMAYTDFTSATNYVEFHYYRSVDTKNASAQHDQVIIYKLTSAGVWSTITREVMLNIVNGNGIDRSVENGDMTLSVKTPSDSGLTVNSDGVVVTRPVPSPAAEDSGKVLGVIDANGTIGWKVAESIDSVILSVGSNTGTPSGTASVSNGVLTINLDGIIGPPGQSAIRTRIDYAANENTQVGLAWDTVHVWPVVSGLDVNLAAAPADGKEHLLSIVFETPADITNFTLSLDPQHILWGSDINLSNVLKENTRYEISIPSTSMIALFTAATLPSNNS